MKKLPNLTAALSRPILISVKLAALNTIAITKRTLNRAISQMQICAIASVIPGVRSSLFCIGLLFVFSGVSFGASAEALNVSDPLLIEVFRAVLVALATWAALKVEIAAAKITADAAKASADAAHDRIDAHLENRRKAE